MKTIKALTEDFLSQKTIAVVGISLRKQTVANGVYKKLKSEKRTVFPIGRNTEIFENEKCFSSLSDLPQKVDGVFIAANKENIEQTIRECISLSIPRIWIHNAGGITKTPDISLELLSECKNKSITIIPGACPMMFVDNADFGHKCMKWVLAAMGKMKMRE